MIPPRTTLVVKQLAVHGLEIIQSVARVVYEWLIRFLFSVLTPKLQDLGIVQGNVAAVPVDLGAQLSHRSPDVAALLVGLKRKKEL